MSSDEKETVVALCSRLVNEHFEKHPFEKAFELDEFKAPETGLLASLLRPDVSLPKKPIPKKPAVKNSDEELTMEPSLLLHGLKHLDRAEVEAKPVYEFIDATSDMCSGLYGTSGAGKTRSVFEYLSLNFGLYFVASARNDPGSKDFQKALASCQNRCVQCVEDKDSQEEKFPIVSFDNHKIVDAHMKILVFVRNTIFSALNEQLEKKDPKEELTPYQWLLVQLFPKEAMDDDLFATVAKQCIGHHFFLRRVGRLDMTITDAIMLGEPLKWKWKTMVVDEAQVLLDDNKSRPKLFRGTKGESRSIISPILESMKNTVDLDADTGYPLICGTGMSLEELYEQSRSIAGKNPNAPNQESTFTGFEPLKESEVEKYLLSFLKLETSQEESQTANDNQSEPKPVQSTAVVKHICKWLRGRPRFSASFLEVYLIREGREGFSDCSYRSRGNFSEEGAVLMQALDRYLDTFTTAAHKDVPEGEKRRKSFDPPKGTPYSIIKDLLSSSTDGETRYSLVKALERAFFKFAVTGEEVPIEDNIAQLIEFGVCRLKLDSRDKAVLDEPIMVQAGINYFSLRKMTRDNMTNQESGGLGDAFERFLLPAIQQRLPDVLQKQLKEHGGSVLGDFWVSTRSAYGVLAKDCKTCQDTLDWLEGAVNAKFDGQVPPFCYPDRFIGPDLMFLMWNKPFTKFVAAISQIKFRNNVKQMDALRTITPALLYYQKRGKPDEAKSPQVYGTHLEERWITVRSRLVGVERGCLRFMVQYPAESTTSATPGAVDDDTVSPKQALVKHVNKRRKVKLGWLATISSGNADDFFADDGETILNALKDASLPARDEED